MLRRCEICCLVHTIYLSIYCIFVGCVSGEGGGYNSRWVTGMAKEKRDVVRGFEFNIENMN